MYEKTYHARVLKQEEKSVPSRRPWVSWKRFLILFVCVVLIGGSIFLIRHPGLQINTIEVTGTIVLDTEDISQNLFQQLEGHWLWVFPRTSVFLLRDKVLEEHIKNTFSRVETVVIKRANFHTVSVSIKEFDAVYLWCTSVEDTCFFMDKQGVVYSEAPVFSGTAYPKIMTGAPVEPLPFQAMNSSEVGRITELEHRLSDIHIIPTVFRYDSERDLRIEFLHNRSVAELLIDRTIATDTSLEYLFSGIRTEPLSTLFYNQEKKLLYIDVRFPNKIVYKFE